MNRKQWLWLTGCCCLLIMLLMLPVLLWWTPQFSPRTPRTPTPRTQPTVPITQPTLPLTAPTTAGSAAVNNDPLPYARVGGWEGYLAVFPPEGGEPAQIYDVRLSSLPPAEQALLAAGISVWDAAELARVLEDYTS